MPSNAKRISRLRSLIEHPRTGESERAAAQRMLERLLEKMGQTEPVGDRSYGSRYHQVGKHATLDSVADMVRADIALARVVFANAGHPGEVAVSHPIADAPDSITYSVETPYFGTIVVSIDGIPDDWGWVSEDGIETVSPALRALADELTDIMNAYNHDGSDIDKRFFGKVRARGETLVF
ncbi:hypothetical protein [Nocardia sp. NPDC050406]|uniref:hypothetical protein n=1 Tax=Nocardia sp. NPDC050406 TaxID=3364318 RepID=UPI0037B9C783